MTLEDFIRRFPIEGDWEEDYARQGWQEDAVKEFLDKMSEIQSDISSTEADGA